MWLLSVPSFAAEAPAYEVAPARASGRIVVDGRLDEADWAAAPVVDDLVMIDPESGPMAPPTAFRLLYDDRALYVGVTCEADPKKLLAPLSPRDDTQFHDWVAVYLDTYRDGKRAFAFKVTPRGVQADGIFTEDSDGLWMHDLAWDGVWTSEGQRTDDGYVAEFAIPFATVRYEPDGDDWSILLVRFVSNPWSMYVWPPHDRARNGTLVQAARLGPFAPPDAGPSIELLPTLVGGWNQTEGGFVDPGLSAKVGVTSSLTADLAVNPDFSQIEADEFQVAANAKLPLVFNEKRPFFLDNRDLFSTPIETLYTRSIVDPSAGVKLTGRSGGWAVGALTAADENPTPSSIFVDYASGAPRRGWGEEDLSGRRSLASVFRVRRDLGEGSGVGVLYSDKELVGTHTSFDRSNRVVGADANARAGAYEGGAQVLYSHTTFEEGAERGPAWTAWGGRGDDHWSFDLEHRYLSPGFRAENGFLEEVGRIEAEAAGGYRFDAFGPVRWLEPKLGASASFDPAGNLVLAEIEAPLVLMVAPDIYTETEFELVRERYAGVDFDRWNWTGFFGVDPIPDVFVALSWDLGPLPHYDAVSAEDLFLGGHVETGAWVTANLFHRVSLEYNGVFDQFRRPGEGPLYTTFLHRAETRLNLSRVASFRIIEQVDTFEDVLQQSALFGLEWNYGTVVYVGYDEEFDLDAGEALGRGVFAKIGYLGRPRF